MTETTTWTVAGMTCGHCVASVTEELLDVGAIETVEVDLSTGLVTVTSAGPLAREVVAAAVDEAGYTLA